MESAKADASFAEVAKKCLTGVAAARKPEPVGHADHVLDPLGVLALRQQVPMIAERPSRICRSNA